MAKVDVWTNSARLWSFVREHKLYFFLTLAASLFLESTFVADKYLFKLIIDEGSAFGQGLASRPDFVSTIVFVLIVLGGLLLARAVSRWVFIHALNRLDNTLILDLKRKFFNHIVHLDHNFHTTHKTGSLISRMTRGGRSIEAMMDSVAFNFSALVFQLIVATFAVSFVDFRVALVLFAFVAVYLGWSLTMFHRQLPFQKHANDVEDREKGDISDIFTNIESIKYYGKEDLIRKRYERLTHRTYMAYMRTWDMFRTIDAGQAVIFTLGPIALLVFPVLSLLNGTGTIGDVAFVFTVFLSMVGPLWGFAFGVRNYYRAMTDFESLYEYMEFDNEIKDKKTATPLTVTEGRIVFNGVSFGYDDSELFSRFDLAIEPNTKLALVGRSGSGKSSLVKLLYRFHDVADGAITIDGADVRDVQQESLRSELSIVPQEGVLFDDTIFNNIAFSNPDASKDDVWEAIRFAQLDKLIANLPKKERTIVGERGVKLSGGERQRVSIARALLANKKILVLDEATSALDSETEHDIQADLKELMNGRTSIIIAHRLSTIMSADVIVVLDAGKIIQQGTHDALVKKKGLYQKLWGLQRGGYIE